MDPKDRDRIVEAAMAAGWSNTTRIEDSNLTREQREEVIARQQERWATLEHIKICNKPAGEIDDDLDLKVCPECRWTKIYFSLPEGERDEWLAAEAERAAEKLEQMIAEMKKLPDLTEEEIRRRCKEWGLPDLPEEFYAELRLSKTPN